MWQSVDLYMTNENIVICNISNNQDGMNIQYLSELDVDFKFVHDMRILFPLLTG